MVSGIFEIVDRLFTFKLDAAVCCRCKVFDLSSNLWLCGRIPLQSVSCPLKFGLIILQTMSCSLSFLISDKDWKGGIYSSVSMVAFFDLAGGRMERPC